MIYLALLPNPFMHAAGSDAPACAAAVLVVPPSQPAADPTCKESLQVHDRSHAEQLDELEALIAANNASCEDDVPLFLRRARA